MWKWIMENREWIFSGVGVSIIVGILGLFGLRSKKQQLNQISS